MSCSAAQKAGEAILTPRLSGERTPQRYTTSAVAATQALWGYTGAPTSGKCYIRVTAETSDVRVAFTTSGAASITASKGEPIPAGQFRDYWVDIAVDVNIEHVATAAGAIVVMVNSVVAEKDGSVI